LIEKRGDYPMKKEIYDHWYGGKGNRSHMIRHKATIHYKNGISDFTVPNGCPRK
jgi:hypothetical protein